MVACEKCATDARAVGNIGSMYCDSSTFRIPNLRRGEAVLLPRVLVLPEPGTFRYRPRRTRPELDMKTSLMEVLGIDHPVVFAGLLLQFTLSCASGSLEAREPIDWAAANDRWSIHIVTTDSDGDERVTRIWLAMMDGVGVLRTGDSRWWQNLARDPNCRIRLLGIEYPLRAEPVREHDERARIDAAFVEKYGWQERMLFPQEPGETHDNYARLRARDPEP